MARLITKKSTVAAKVPLAADLEIGELAVNTADARIYTKHSNGNVVAMKAEPLAHTHAVADTPGLQTALNGKEAAGAATSALSAHVAAPDPHPQYTTTAEAAAAAPVQSVAGKTGAVALVKADVGLGNVDNTSDANKPVSTAQAATIAAEVANRVRYDAAQTLTSPQQAQARANIGAQSAAAIGDPDRDLVADYTAAKA